MRTLVNTTSEVVEWLESKGLRFNSVTEGQYKGVSPKVRHMFAPGRPGRIGKGIVETLANNCRNLGVQLLRETAAKKILNDEKGRVTGVLAARRGKEIKIATKAVIIAAGGFAGNKEMMDKYLHPKSKRVCLSLPLTGDGLAIAEEVGAVIDDIFHTLCMGPCHYGYTMSLNLLVRCPEVIWVNKFGEHFCDESLFAANSHQATEALNRQPDETCYALLDSETLRNLIEKRGEYGDMGTEWLDQLYDDFKKDSAKGVAKVAKTWGEIASISG